jgi:hypothetical protein
MAFWEGTMVALFVAVFAVIGLAAVLVGGIVAIAIGQAWILQHVWQWYAVAVFGMPSLKLSHCFLLSYAVGLLTHQGKEDKEHPYAPLAGSLVGWLLFLLFAWYLR